MMTNENKYTSEYILSTKQNTSANEYHTRLDSEADAQMAADILSYIASKNISVIHASAILKDCDILLTVFGKI